MEVRVYAKIQSSMWDGTLGGTGEVWAVFVFLLAKCDAEGYVDIHPKVIAGLTGFAEDRVVEALRALEAPDPGSRSREMGGARLERLDEHREWGWRIVNYVRYRSLTTPETVREQNRQRVKVHREKKRSVTLGNGVTVPVTVGNALSRQAEAEVEEEESKSTHLSTGVDVSVSGSGGRLPLPKRAARRAPVVSPLDAEWEETFHEVHWPSWLEFKPGCSKAAALKAWLAIPHPEGQADFDRLDSAFTAYRELRGGADPKFRKDASTWLNDYHKNLLIGA